MLPESPAVHVLGVSIAWAHQYRHLAGAHRRRRHPGPPETPTLVGRQCTPQKAPFCSVQPAYKGNCWVALSVLGVALPVWKLVKLLEIPCLRVLQACGAFSRS